MYRDTVVPTRDLDAWERRQSSAYWKAELGWEHALQVVALQDGDQLAFDVATREARFCGSMLDHTIRAELAADRLAWERRRAGC